MIIAKITNEHDYHSLRIEGHAGYAEHGKDIICAAVSAYTYALLEYCETNEIAMQEEEVSPGYTYLFTTDNRVTEALSLIQCGMECLERAYPEYVRVGGRNSRRNYVQ